MVGWKGKQSLRAYVPKNERIHYLRLIGGDTSKFESNKFQNKRDIEARNVTKTENSNDSPEDGSIKEEKED